MKKKPREACERDGCVGFRLGSFTYCCNEDEVVVRLKVAHADEPGPVDGPDRDDQEGEAEEGE